MKNFVYILTDEKATENLIQGHLKTLGYESQISNSVAQFHKNLIPGKKYFLIVDYLLIKNNSHSLLQPGRAPAGLLVMSGLSGFEDFLREIAERYTEQNIPFLFLERSFTSEELAELLIQLTKGFQQGFLRCLRRPKYSYQNQKSPGPILCSARENLGLERANVVSVACKRGFWIDENRLEEIEQDRSGRYISAKEWFWLVHLLFESADCVNAGFDPWGQLWRVRQALECKTYPFPMNFTLRRGLVELMKREKIEAKYSTLVKCAAPPIRIN